MAVLDLYDSQEHSNNFAHLAAMVHLAYFDGKISDVEKSKLKKFSEKLKIDDSELANLLKNPKQFPITPLNSSEKRLRRIFDFFKIVFADHTIDDQEKTYVYEYAKALGFSPVNVEKVIDRSIRMFSGEFDFEDFASFIKK